MENLWSIIIWINEGGSSQTKLLLHNRSDLRETHRSTFLSLGMKTPKRKNAFEQQTENVVYLQIKYRNLCVWVNNLRHKSIRFFFHEVSSPGINHPREQLVCVTLGTHLHCNRINCRGFDLWYSEGKFKEAQPEWLRVHSKHRLLQGPQPVTVMEGDTLSPCSHTNAQTHTVCVLNLLDQPDIWIYWINPNAFFPEQPSPR